MSLALDRVITIASVIVHLAPDKGQSRPGERRCGVLISEVELGDVLGILSLCVVLARDNICELMTCAHREAKCSGQWSLAGRSALLSAVVSYLNSCKSSHLFSRMKAYKTVMSD